MTNSILAGELKRIVLLAVGCSVAGILLGQWLPCLLLGLAGYVAWHLYNLISLHRWLKSEDAEDIPDVGGLWGEAFQRLYQNAKHQKQLKTHLKQVINRYQRATRALPDGIVVLGSDDEIYTFNDAAGRLLALKHPDDLGHPILNFVREPSFRKYLEKKDFEHPHHLTSTVNPDVQLSIRLIPDFQSDGQQLLIIRDVTRLHWLENIRRDFVANISHELKTPLTVLGGYIETLSEDEYPHEWRTPMREMQAQVERMNRLIDDLLKLSKLETHQTAASSEPVDMAQMCADVIREAQALSMGKHKIEIDIQGGVQLTGEQNWLRMAFSNLLANAVFYTPEGGTIFVKWHVDDVGAYFIVKDSGLGIEPQDLPRLTERFYRTDAGRELRSGGTGLGLAIVKHVVARHFGQLEIDSAPGEGTTVTCQFPLSSVVLEEITKVHREKI